MATLIAQTILTLIENSLRSSGNGNSIFLASSKALRVQPDPHAQIKQNKNESSITYHMRL
jgi:hypothetical protein